VKSYLKLVIFLLKNTRNCILKHKVYLIANMCIINLSYVTLVQTPSSLSQSVTQGRNPPPFPPRAWHTLWTTPETTELKTVRYLRKNRGLCNFCPAKFFSKSSCEYKVVLTYLRLPFVLIPSKCNLSTSKCYFYQSCKSISKFEHKCSKFNFNFVHF